MSRVHWKPALWLSSPDIVTVLWFEVLSNHTQIHLAPSSRSAAMALAIALAATVLTIERRPSAREVWKQLGILRTKLPLLRSHRTS